MKLLKDGILTEDDAPPCFGNTTLPISRAAVRSSKTVCAYCGEAIEDPCDIGYVSAEGYVMHEECLLEARDSIALDEVAELIGFWRVNVYV